MNKTIIININGIIFHIEEDAYEVLKKYMTEVKRHFMDSADSLEITTDIENRIAEMFTEILNTESKQVIIEQDVNAVIHKMGTVADFAGEEENKNAGHNAFQYKNVNRRLFRDGEDHLLGGVCAGIASYFNIQPVWIRLAFAISFFFFGTGLLLYVILWIVVPRAVSRTDRMAMKGEPLDLQGFKRNFDDEVKGLKGHATALHQEARPFIYKTRDFAGDFFDHLRAFLNESGIILLKILGVVIMIICFGLIIASLIVVFALFAYGSKNTFIGLPFIRLQYEYSMFFISSCFFLLALPLLGLALKTSNLVFNRAPIGRITGYILLLVWITSVCIVTYYSVQTVSEFRSGGKISQTINIKPTPGNVYHLKMNDVRYLSSQDSAKLDIKNTFGGKTVIDDGPGNNDFTEFEGRNVTISIEKSNVPQPVLIENFMARGNNYNNALINARNIIYRFTQTDSLLLFDRHIQYAENSAWRRQKVSLVLKVPVGAELVIDKSIGRYLYDVDFDSCQTKTTLEHYRTAPFKMTENGLECYIPQMQP